MDGLFERSHFFQGSSKLVKGDVIELKDISKYFAVSFLVS